MDAIKQYGNLVRKKMNNPTTALKLLKNAYTLEKFRVTKFPNKSLPKSSQYLNQICLKYILEPLQNPERSAFVNLFAPTEFLHAMNIYPSFVEAFSSFLSGTKCEDGFIDYAENAGIAETLCSYHKAFLGAVESNVIPKPKFAVTSSMICDANINTFKYVANKYNVPSYVIDVPYEYNRDSEEYVVSQLKEMVDMIEDSMKEKLNEEKLMQVIKVENDSRKYMRKYIDSLSTKYFPTTLTLEMYKLFTSHVAMGRNETLNFYKMQAEEIETYPNSDCTKILWVHLIPFYHKALREYFNLSDKYQLLICDLNFDFLGDMDYTKPYNAIAKKMLLNHSNGNFNRKADAILDMSKKLKADGVINFCHWGCKQSSGGSLLLKNILKEENIPYISIDGDGVDRRNSQDGQLKTRLEAFFEMIDKENKK